MIELNCPECGKPFEKTHWRKMFCSFPCQNRSKSRNWRAANPIQAKVLDKKSRDNCRENRLPRMRAWHEANKEQQNEKRREWHHSHKGEANERRSAHYYADHELHKENQKVRNYDARLTHPWRALLHGARARALKKKVPYALTKEWAMETWTGRCAVTNVEFKLGLREWGPKAFSPSIDRIVPSLGYVPGNCRFVLWMVNAFKYDGTDEDMIAIARAIVENVDRKNMKTSVISKG
jgi:hypothetical protein